MAQGYFKDEENILDIYFDEAGQFPLLTLQEEQSLLAKYIKYRDNKGKCSTRQRLKAMEAREKLINCNLKLVIKIAKDYQRMGLELADLISEGNKGLMRAVEKYEMGKGAKLSTYASFWIRQCLTKALSNDSRTIRIPVNLAQTRSAVLKFKDKFQLRKGFEPSDDVVMKEFGLSKQQLKRVSSHHYSYVSLDKKIGDDGYEDDATTIANMIPDKEQKNPLEILGEVNANENLHDVLKKLKPREQSILELRFGLNNQDYHTLESIGDKFNLTRERIRQIEKVALKKLKVLMINRNKIKKSCQ